MPNIRRLGVDCMNDKEGRKWLLQKLYDNGIKYIAFCKYYNGYVGLRDKPLFMKTGDLISASNYIITIGDLLPDFNEPNYLDIGKYLGIVDWSKVKVDTPIVVKIKDQCINRHFARYNDNKVYFYSNGKTSWTALSTDWINQTCARLAGGDDEN